MVVLRAARRRATTNVSEKDDSTASRSPSKQSSQQPALRNQTLDSFRSLLTPFEASSSSSQRHSQLSPKSRTASQTLTPQLTPRKTKKASPAKKADAKTKSKGRTIHSFFDRAAQKQQNGTSSFTQEVEADINIELADLIEDDSLDEDIQKTVNKQDVVDGSSTALAFRKRSREAWGGDTTLEVDDLGSRSFKFQKLSTGDRSVAEEPVDNRIPSSDPRPWTEKFGPSNIEELAVHKKKVNDVRNWLGDVLGGRTRKRLLILKGAAGTAKTTTISLLAKEFGAGIKEWRNTGSGGGVGSGTALASSQFEEFLRISGQFSSLELTGQSTQADPIEPVSDVSKQHVILVEEFPNTFTSSSTAMQSFRSIIRQYLAASGSTSVSIFSNPNEAPEDIVPPIVMVISETLLTTTTAAADSFTAHRLLGPDIMNHPYSTVIEFNPIAPTILSKALNLVIQKEARVSGRRKAPGPQVLKHLSEIGDVRSSISSLEFLCVRGDDGDGWGGKVAFGKSKKSTKEVPLTKMERESLELVSQRESTLGIFHAVGKVVYNKRQSVTTSSDPIVQPPSYLPQYHRLRPSEVDVNTLIDELGTDTDTFIAALHENYVLSCTGATDEDTADCISDCVDALSEADLLSPNRFNAGRGRTTFRYHGGTTDFIRQDELSFQFSVRSLLFSLPNPVKRVVPPPQLIGAGIGRGGGGLGSPSKSRIGGRTDAFRMFFPTSLRLWQPREEMEGLLDMAANRAQRGDLRLDVETNISFPASKAEKPDPGAVESWGRNSQAMSMPGSTPFHLHKPKFKPHPGYQSSIASSTKGSATTHNLTSHPVRKPEAPSSTVPPTSCEHKVSEAEEEHGNSPRISFIPRNELLLERLPYLALIHRRRKATASFAGPTVLPASRDWEKLTKFGVVGRSISGDQEEDSEMPQPDEQWTTDPPVEKGSSPKRRKTTMSKVGHGGGAVAMMVGQPDSGAGKGLVLSDDDIESD